MLMEDRLIRRVPVVISSQTIPVLHVAKQQGRLT